MEKTKLVIDTNLWVSMLIGKRLASLRELCNDERFVVYICDELILEFEDVMTRAKIKKYVAVQDVADTITSMKLSCIGQKILVNAVSPIRDRKDLYLLSLADTIQADYILTGDKDLLVLQTHNQTQIVTYSAFMAQLNIK
jgi:putative PIN family toxin of toxin-antitoxin system